MKSNTLNISIKFLAICVILGLSACKKEGCTDALANNYDSKSKTDDGSCTYDVTINVEEPLAHSTHMSGDTIHIHAEIETAGEIHGYEVHVYNVSNGNEEVFMAEKDVHESPIHIEESFVISVAAHSDMLLEIKAFTDHDGGYESKTVEFHCHPM